MLPLDHSVRVSRVRQCLEGLSVGDAFGNCFFANPHMVERLIELRAVPAGPWAYTDDTIMALAIVEMLEKRGAIEQDILADSFARKYQRDPSRGYGGTAHGILTRLAAAEDWRSVAQSVFSGMGSMGNGGAMRAAPIGAYFSDNLDAAAVNARLSAEVTHAHPEGQAGAIAIAVAGAWAASSPTDPRQLFAAVLEYLPKGETRTGVLRAADLPLDYDVRTAVFALGNGTRVLSQDTVPFSLWCAARHLQDFVEAMWSTVSGLGDRDTTCAIVGGIVALAGYASIPTNWLADREPLVTMEG
jgi:ADP-ribosylglycohydrolase